MIAYKDDGSVDRSGWFPATTHPGISYAGPNPNELADALDSANARLKAAFLNDPNYPTGKR